MDWQVHPIRHGWANSFLLESKDELVLVDSGRPGFLPSFERQFAVLGRSLRDLSHLILTHAHPDHSGNALALQAASGADIWAHADVAELLAKGQTFAPYTPRPDPIGWIVEKMVVSRAERHIAPVQVNHTLQDGDRLPLAGGLQVLGTPGHAKGHLAFLSPEQGGTLFTGDALVNLPWLHYPYVAEDWPTARASAARLANLDVAAVYFGHGPPLLRRASARLKRRFLS